MKKHLKIAISTAVVLMLGIGYLVINNFPKTLIVKEAAVKIKVSGSIRDLYYLPPRTTPNTYYFSSKKITKLDSQCAAEAISLGAMTVFADKVSADGYIAAASKITTGKVTTKTVLQPLNGKYYIFDGGSNQLCSGKKDVQDLQRKLTNEFITAGTTIKQL